MTHQTKPRRDETYAEAKARWDARTKALLPAIDPVEHARMSWRYYIDLARESRRYRCPDLIAHALASAAVWRRHLARAKWQTNRRAAA